MSRIGKQLVLLEKGIAIHTDEEQGLVHIQKGGQSLKVPLPPGLELKREEGRLAVIRTKDDKKTRALHGLTRALIQNAVTGLSKGWSRSLELNGVGYKAMVSGRSLQLNLGFSHPVTYKIPDGVQIKAEKQTKLSIHGADKALVGLTASQIRAFRPVEPYLAKGIKYTDEQVRRKAGKSGGDKK